MKELQKQSSLSQDEELVRLLAENPTGNIQYDKSILQVLRTSLEQLGQAAHGTSTTELLSRLAYLDPKSMPVDWLLTFFPEDRSLLKQETRKALALLEQYSLVQWDRAHAQVYLHEVTQQVIRHLHPQPSLEKLIAGLIAHVGEESDAEQYASRWIPLLPHGRMLYARLDCTKYPQEAVSLTRYLARACQAACLFEEWLQWREEALSIAQQRYPTQDHPDIAASFNNVGKSLGQLGKEAEGLNYHKQALAMRQRLYKVKNHPYMADSLDNVGVILGRLGKLKEGLACHQQAMKMLQRVFGNQDLPDVARSLHNMGYTLGTLGKLKDGLAYLKEGLAMQQRLYKNQEHPSTADFFHKMGYTLVQLGKLKEGLAYLEQAMEMLQRVFGNQDHPWTADMRYSMGEALVKAGVYQKAMVYHKKSLAMQKRIYKDQDHPLLAATCYSLGEALQGLGKLRKEIPCYTQAVGTALRLYKKEYPPVTQYLNSLTELLNKVTNRTCIQQTKKSVLPLCMQWLGENHLLTQQLGHAGK